MLLVGIVYFKKSGVEEEIVKPHEIEVLEHNQEQNQLLDKAAREVQSTSNKNYQRHNKNNRKKVKNINKKMIPKHHNIQQPSKRGA